jgi:sarcosine oxidase subunit beta
MRNDSADVVVIGAGTIGGWASYFATENGAKKVVVIDSGQAGSGASSRAAGMVRAQGGTLEAVQLGRWSIDFYRRQKDLIGTDSGFRELGYILLAASDHDAKDGKARVEMQRQLGLDVKWLSPKEIVEINTSMARVGWPHIRLRCHFQ